MPLTMAGIGETNTISRIGGNEETSVFWQTLDLLQERKLLYCRRSEAM